MTVHNLIHTKELPFKCVKCYAGYKENETLTITFIKFYFTNTIQLQAPVINSCNYKIPSHMMWVAAMAAIVSSKSALKINFLDGLNIVFLMSNADIPVTSLLSSCLMWVVAMAAIISFKSALNVNFFRWFEDSFLNVQCRHSSDQFVD